MLLPWLMVFGAGLCLRTGISSLSPMLDTIQHQLGIGSSYLGLLTAIPVVCMGVLSPLGHAFDRRFGLKTSMMLAFIVLMAGLALRLKTETFGLLLLTAALVGIGDAIIRPLLSGFIKETFHDRTHAAMGVYATAMGVGSAVAAYTTPFLSTAYGSWQGGLAFWAIPALIAAMLWVMWSGGAKHEAAEVPRGQSQRLDHLGRVALTLFFGLQAGINYTIVAWLPSLYLASGFAQQASSGFIAVFMLLQTLTSLFFPLLMRLMRVKVAGAMIIYTVCALTGFLMLGDLSQTVWAAAVLLGIATGGLFPIALLLPLEFSSSREEATRISGVTQSGGYLLGGAMPWVAGIATAQMGPVKGITALCLGMGIILLIVVAQVRKRYLQRVQQAE
ncbi:MFS transporter [Pantoea sp. Acro-835]|uniref:MFS transporter n=2 Tax=Candidatus Pantoea multigeneris TaxID=2608357 RepID=A0ABX0R9C5_9GAMM|nr:MFS transporter [Pantoea multigeneris]